MKASLFPVALVGCLALILAACSQQGVFTLPGKTLSPSATASLDADAQTGPATILPPHEPTNDSTQATQPTQLPAATSGLESLIAQAKEDLAQRLALSVAEIKLVKAEAVVWPDASLGCPQPGMEYLQVPEDGALIVLQVEGTLYEYHNGGSRGLFLCERIYKDPNPPPKIDIFNLTPSKPVAPSTPDNSIPPGADN